MAKACTGLRRLPVASPVLFGNLSGPVLHVRRRHAVTRLRLAAFQIIPQGFCEPFLARVFLSRSGVFLHRLEKAENRAGSKGSPGFPVPGAHDRRISPAARSCDSNAARSTDPAGTRFNQETTMRNALRLILAGLLVMWAMADAMAQTRSRAQTRSQAATPPVGTSGLPDCSQRPFARDCDRRGTW